MLAIVDREQPSRLSSNESDAVATHPSAMRSAAVSSSEASAGAPRKTQVENATHHKEALGHILDPNVQFLSTEDGCGATPTEGRVYDDSGEGSLPMPSKHTLMNLSSFLERIVKHPDSATTVARDATTTGDATCDMSTKHDTSATSSCTTIILRPTDMLVEHIIVDDEPRIPLPSDIATASLANFGMLTDEALGRLCTDRFWQQDMQCAQDADATAKDVPQQQYPAWWSNRFVLERDDRGWVTSASALKAKSHVYLIATTTEGFRCCIQVEGYSPFALLRLPNSAPDTIHTAEEILGLRQYDAFLGGDISSGQRAIESWTIEEHYSARHFEVDPACIEERKEALKWAAKHNTTIEEENKRRTERHQAPLYRPRRKRYTYLKIHFRSDFARQRFASGVNKHQQLRALSFTRSSKRGPAQRRELLVPRCIVSDVARISAAQQFSIETGVLPMRWVRVHNASVNMARISSEALDVTATLRDIVPEEPPKHITHAPSQLSNAPLSGPSETPGSLPPMLCASIDGEMFGSVTANNSQDAQAMPSPDRQQDSIVQVGIVLYWLHGVPSTLQRAGVKPNTPWLHIIVCVVPPKPVACAQINAGYAASELERSAAADRATQRVLPNAIPGVHCICVADESALLNRVRDILVVWYRAQVQTGYNTDQFDWPYFAKRARFMAMQPRRAESAATVNPTTSDSKLKLKPRSSGSSTDPHHLAPPLHPRQVLRFHFVSSFWLDPVRLTVKIPPPPLPESDPDPANSVGVRGTGSKAAAPKRRAPHESRARGCEEYFFAPSGLTCIDLLSWARKNLNLHRYTLNDVSEVTLKRAPPAPKPPATADTKSGPAGTETASGVTTSGVAQNQKLDVTFRDINAAWLSQHPTDVSKVAAYCVQDCVLVMRIDIARNVVSSIAGFARGSASPFGSYNRDGDDARGRSGILLECRSLDFVADGLGDRNSRFTVPPDDNISGGTVLRPPQAQHFFVDSPESDQAVAGLDFKSLYPSIMISYNVGFSSFVASMEELDRCRAAGVLVMRQPGRLAAKKGEELWFVLANQGGPPDETSSPGAEHGRECERASGLSFSFPEYRIHQGFDCLDKGTDGFVEVLASLEVRLWKNRQVAKRRMGAAKSAGDTNLALAYDIEQLSCKLLMNSQYGLMCAKAPSYGSWHAADAITTRGGQMLRDCIDYVEMKYGAVVVYGDTDSIFCTKPKLEAKDCWGFWTAVADDLSRRFPGVIEMEYEKVYGRLALRPLKKNYAGRYCENRREWEAFLAGTQRLRCADNKGDRSRKRDSSVLLKDVAADVDRILFDTYVHESRDMRARCRQAFSVVQERLLSLVENRIPLSSFVMTKQLKGALHYRGHPPLQMAVAIAMAFNAPGSEPQVGDRVRLVISEVADPSRTRVRATAPPGMDVLAERLRQSWRAKNATERAKMLSLKCRSEAEVLQRPDLHRVDRLYYLTTQLANPFLSRFGDTFAAFGVNLEGLFRAAKLLISAQMTRTQYLNSRELWATLGKRAGTNMFRSGSVSSTSVARVEGPDASSVTPRSSDACSQSDSVDCAAAIGKNTVSEQGTKFHNVDCTTGTGDNRQHDQHDQHDQSLDEEFEKLVRLNFRSVILPPIPKCARREVASLIPRLLAATTCVACQARIVVAFQMARRQQDQRRLYQHEVFITGIVDRLFSMKTDPHSDPLAGSARSDDDPASHIVDYKSQFFRTSTTAAAITSETHSNSDLMASGADTAHVGASSIQSNPTSCRELCQEHCFSSVPQYLWQQQLREFVDT